MWAREEAEEEEGYEEEEEMESLEGDFGPFTNALRIANRVEGYMAALEHIIEPYDGVVAGRLLKALASMFPAPLVVVRFDDSLMAESLFRIIVAAKSGNTAALAKLPEDVRAAAESIAKEIEGVRQSVGRVSPEASGGRFLIIVRSLTGQPVVGNKFQRDEERLLGSIDMGELFFVVFCSDPAFPSHPDLKNKAIFLDIKPSENEYREFLRLLGVANADEIAPLCGGLPFARVETLATVLGKNGRIDPLAFAEAKASGIREPFIHVKLPELGLEDLSLDNVLEEALKELVIEPFTARESIKEAGVSPSFCVIVATLGGVGGRELAEALAKELGLLMFEVDTVALGSRYYGETEKNLRKAIQILRQNAPCVAYVNMAALVPARKKEERVEMHELTRRIMAVLSHELTTQSEYLAVVEIGNVSDADEKLLRAFSNAPRVILTFPGREARERYLKKLLSRLKGVSVEVAEETVSRLAKDTWGLSHRELENVVAMAVNLALKNGGKLTDKVLFDAFGRVRFDRRERVKDLKQGLERVEELGLHPSLQYDVAGFIADAAARKELQAVVETQSEHVLLGFARAFAEGRIPSLRAYSFRLEGGFARVEPLAVGKDGSVEGEVEGFRIGPRARG